MFGHRWVGAGVGAGLVGLLGVVFGVGDAAAAMP
jgi:hypothetical protein